MRKLNFLKTIVDYLWMISLITYPLLLLFSIITIFNNEVFDVPIKLYGNEVILDSVIHKIGFLILVSGFSLVILAIYNFRKLLRLLQEKKIFETETSSLFYKIGQLIIYFSFIDIIVETILNLSKNNVILNIGFGTFLSFLSLGLFFIVLSEVFKIGQKIKEQNELTI
ncbi:DUF2975 domain-containing protein [Flavobacterium facile]|uniref:DUF2975 domain-containing protein n=1 Tax=Flavobacterium facile TaxID=2893174 RepID=UPI002E79F438|nr:DUF2975 domain-containing protein [Flavobacterium sp. T-12]